VRLNTRDRKPFGDAAVRALLHVTARPLSEPERLAGSFALSGVSLFGKGRLAVRKNRTQPHA